MEFAVSDVSMSEGARMKKIGLLAGVGDLPVACAQAAKAFFDGTFEAKYALIGAALTLGLMLAAYLRYTRADIPAL